MDARKTVHDKETCNVGLVSTMSSWEEHYDVVRQGVKPTINWMFLQRKNICEVCGNVSVLCGPCDVKYICPCGEDYSVRVCICPKCSQKPYDEMIRMKEQNKEKVLQFLREVRARRRNKPDYEEGEI